MNDPTLHQSFNRGDALDKSWFFKHPSHFPRPCLIDRALEQAALIHWPQVCIAAITAFAAGLLAGWGWM